MGQTSFALVGSPPVITSLAWVAWYFRLLTARVDACPLARTTTYYFAQAGNDTTGTGTEALPWKTLAKAQTVLTASSGDVRLRFKRGDTWRETTGLTIAKANITVDDYGTALTPPWWRRWDLTYNATGWTQAGATNRWTRTEAGTVEWVRWQDDPNEVVFQKLASTATVESTPLSFYWDGTTLHFNPGVGVNPNTRNYEAVTRNTTDGIWINDVDNVRIRNLRIDGYGFSTAAQGYGLRVANRNANEAVVENCEVFWGGYHCIGHVSPGANGGGIATFLRCKAGYSANYTNPTIYVSYADTGSQETIFHGCEASYGVPPDSTWYNATTAPRRGQSIYSHTSTGTAALITVYDFTQPNTDYGCGGTIDLGACPTASALESVRGFVVGERVLGYQPVQVVNAGYLNTAKMNCVYEVMPPADGTALGNTSQGGWVINTTILIDARRITNGNYSLYNGGQPHAPQFWHCFIEIFNATANNFGGLYLGSNPATGNPNARSYNTVWSNRSTRNLCMPNFVNDSSHLGGNAYWGQAAAYESSTNPGGWSGDASGMELATRPTLSIPDASSPLYRSGAAIPGGYVLEYDQNWQPRVTAYAPTVGPLAEVVPTMPVTLTLTVPAVSAGALVTVTATVAPTISTGTPVGNVVFTGESPISPQTKALSGGVAAFEFVAPSAGTYSVAVSYSGGADRSGSWAAASATVGGSLAVAVVPVVARAQQGACSGPAAGFSYSPAPEGCVNV